MTASKRIVFAALAAGLVVLAYSNHFSNDFHFDDSHTITDNPAIRSLANVPRFFTDSSTFSLLPTHQVYRPVLTASLALDYRLAGGYDPFQYHLTTFLWFLVLLCLVYALARNVYAASEPRRDPHWPAFAAALVFGLHPASAETVNYVIQRGDVFAALGVVGGLVLWAGLPRARRFGLYLVPVVAGALAKPPTLIFVAMLALYVAMFEPGRGSRTLRTVRAIAPSLAVAGALGWLLSHMNGPAFHSGGGPALLYRLTQLPVTWSYFAAFFAPIHLSADTDRRLVTGVSDPSVLAGGAFVLALLVLAAAAAARPRGKPIAFGIGFFFLGLLPTALMPLAEVENDHRMFLPFVGLAIAAVWCVRLLVGERLTSPAARAALATAGAAVLALEAYGTHQRNEVWRTELSLWKDVTEKSPKNGRGWMNYGVNVMASGDSAKALELFLKAREHAPSYSNVYVNLGIATADLGRHAEAEPYFLQALVLGPNQASTHFFYGRWLRQVGRHSEALRQLDQAALIAPNDLAVRHLRLETLAALGEWQRLGEEVREVLAIAPDDAAALQNQQLLKDTAAAAQRLEAAVRAKPTPEGWIDVSLRYYQSGLYRDCLRASNEAIALRPEYAEAFNNIAAAHNSLREWDLAIAAAERALALKPDFQLARNNLAVAQAGKRESGAQ
jgi:tetratricopeptide (TPR) repeat protein